MTLTKEFFAFLTYTAMIMVLQSKADQLPPPTGLSYKWLDAFSVNVSWNKPIGLPEDSTISFTVKDGKNKTIRTVWRNITLSFLTEEMHSDHWMVSVWTVSENNSSEESYPVSVPITPRKPRGELVKDFKCLLSSSGMNCSWIPAHQSLNLTLFYRHCGQLRETIKTLVKCDKFYSSGERNCCNLNLDDPKDICLLLETETNMSTFNPKLVIPPLQLRIENKTDYFQLNWDPPLDKYHNCWNYNICYIKCNDMKCETTLENTMNVTSSKKCRIEFRSKVKLLPSCFSSEIESDYSDTISFDPTEFEDWTLTLVAFVVPIILSISVILSCYCFRRHRAIFCPIIPDPSAIFKDIMMNGNKELKTGNLYTPMPESIDSCKVLVTEKSALQQHY